MFSDLTIYVTSSFRHDSMSTFANLAPAILERVIVVVPKGQYAAYLPYCEAAGVQLQAAPNGMLYISPKRQWCLEQCPTKYVCIMDDDLSFFMRDDNLKLRKATIEDSEIIFSEALWHLKHSNKYLVGISARGGNHLYPKDWEDTFRMHRIWFLNIEPFRKLHINLAPYPEFLMQDVHLILTYLENGYNNRVLYKYAQDDKGSNSPGGCSTFRNAATLERAAKWMSAHHPKAVRLKSKETVTGWDGMNELANGKKQRVDINVSWKKAYRPTTRGVSIFAKRKG